MYAALKIGDLELEAMLEFVLHFAVYCGWPKASHLEGHIRQQWARIQRGAWPKRSTVPVLADDTLGPSDWDDRHRARAQEFADVNLLPVPPPDSP